MFLHQLRYVEHEARMRPSVGNPLPNMNNLEMMQ